MPVFNITDPVSVGLSTKADHYHRAFDNTLALYGGETGIVGAAAGDDPYFSTATQLSPGARQLRQTFDGLVLRTHPDADKAAYQLLASCRECVMQDGTRVAAWSNILFDLTASGAGGLDAATEQASTPYSAWLIRKSSDGTKAGLLHRAKSYNIDQSLTATYDAAISVRAAAGNTKRGQTFQAALSGPFEKAGFRFQKVSTLTGRVWLALYATSAGLPTGAALATSDKWDASLFSTTADTTWHDFAFRSSAASPTTPPSVVAGTTYALVAEGDWTINGAQFMQVAADASSPGYANGSMVQYDGASWTATAGTDLLFRTYVTQNDTALTLPSGYDQYCLINPGAYNDSGSNFIPFDQYNRSVRHASRAISGGFTNTTPVLFDLAAIVPPVPVLINAWSAGNSTVGQGVVVQSPFGSQRAYWQASGANYEWASAIAVLVEFQGLYALATANTGFMFMGGWEW